MVVASLLLASVLLALLPESLLLVLLLEFLLLALPALSPPAVTLSLLSRLLVGVVSVLLFVMLLLRQASAA